MLNSCWEAKIKPVLIGKEGIATARAKTTKHQFGSAGAPWVGPTISLPPEQELGYAAHRG